MLYFEENLQTIIVGILDLLQTGDLINIGAVESNKQQLSPGNHIALKSSNNFIDFTLFI